MKNESQDFSQGNGSLFLCVVLIFSVLISLHLCESLWPRSLLCLVLNTPFVNEIFIPSCTRVCIVKKKRCTSKWPAAGQGLKWE